MSQNSPPPSASSPRSSRDAISPRPVVKINGREWAVLTENLRSLRIDEQDGGLGALELHVRNLAAGEGGAIEFAFDGDDVFQLGLDIEVAMGDERDATTMFKGRITAIEERHGGGRPPALVVLAEDALQSSRMARRTKVHSDVSIADIANEIARRLGLRANVDGFTDTMSVAVQLNESDLAFLRRLLAVNDGDLQVVGDSLEIGPVKSARRGTVELDASRDLKECRITADLAHQVTAVTVAGWDETQGERVGVTSDPGDLGPGSGSVGASFLDRHFFARSEHIGQLPVLDDDEAQALADSAHRQRARSFVRLDATAAGDPRLRVGSHVQLSGVGSRFLNTYAVVRTSHRFDTTSGYETDFEALCAYLGDAG